MLTRGQAWALTAIVIAALEPVSWMTSRIPPCIVNAENYGTYYSQNQKCPTLHVVVVPILEKLGDPNWVIAIFTIVLAVSTIFLWVSTRDAARASQAAAEALPNIERAYVFIAPELTFWDDRIKGSTATAYASRIGVRFRIANFGKTPAIVRSIDARLQILPEPPDNRLHRIADFSPEKVLASDEVWEPSLSPRNCETTERDADDINDLRSVIWFYGSIDYLDMFGREHMTRFRWSWSVPLEKFLPRGDAPHNERT